MSTPEGAEERPHARRFTDRIDTLLIAGQLSLGAVALLAFAFWFLVTPSDEGYWYPEILAFSIVTGVVAYLLYSLQSGE